MPIHIPINILDFIFKGMLIGVIASAPMGPVGILCVQRTLNKGRWFGFATGLGAAISDIIYAAFAGFGMSFVMDFITNDQNRFYPSAQATARFLSVQSPGCSAFVIGEPYLYNALYEAGIALNDYDPDYVVIGETFNYNLDAMCKAMRLVEKGAKLIGTNSDLTYPNEQGNVPACRALVSPIELTTGAQAYYVGKPNPLMMRAAMHMMGVNSKETVMIGDRMDTDIIAGIESGMMSVLVLSGVSTVENIKKFPYRPTFILDKVGDIAE